MPVARNGFYNNPAFAQAASNLASLFEPPSGADAAGWATADAKRQEAQRLADFFSSASTLDVDTYDRQGAALGVFAPTQGFGARNMDDATKRYGIDVGASTSRANNTADNERAILDRLLQEEAAMSRLGITDSTARRGQDITADTSRANNAADNARAIQQSQIGSLTDLFGPLNEGQVAPAVPDDIAAILGAPGAIGQREGREKPLTAEEQRAQFMQLLSPDEQRAVAFGNTPTANVVTPEGPRIASSLDSLGQEPYFNRGSEPKPDVVNYRAPDGRAGTAVYDSELGLVDTQNRQPLPQGTQTFKAQAQGAVDDVLGQSTQNRIDKQLIDAAVAKDVAVKLRDMVATSPASQGVVGWLRGTAQNVIAAGGEIGKYFGGSVDDIQKRIAEGLEDQDLAGAFDTNIPAIELMANVLAFQYAKLQGADRLSNEMVRATRSALGLDGLTANQQSSVARLNQAIKMIESQEGILRGARGGGVNAVESTAPPAPPPAAIDNGGAVERWQRGPDGKLIKVQ